MPHFQIWSRNPKFPNHSRPAPPRFSPNFVRLRPPFCTATARQGWDSGYPSFSATQSLDQAGPAHKPKSFPESVKGDRLGIRRNPLISPQFLLRHKTGSGDGCCAFHLWPLRWRRPAPHWRPFCIEQPRTAGTDDTSRYVNNKQTEKTTYTRWSCWCRTIKCVIFTSALWLQQHPPPPLLSHPVNAGSQTNQVIY